MPGDCKKAKVTPSVVEPMSHRAKSRCDNTWLPTASHRA